MRSRLVNGATVRALREAVGVPQVDLAQALAISQPYLSNIEAGRKQPSAKVARLIADRLSVPLDAITYPASTADVAPAAAEPVPA